MKILLVGGTGVIGRFVADCLLAAEHDVIVLHRGMTPHSLAKAMRLIRGDANCLRTLRPELRDASPDVAVDFIVSSERQAKEMMEALTGIAGGVVVLSSMDVYRACGILHETESGGLQLLP